MEDHREASKRQRLDKPPTVISASAAKKEDFTEHLNKKPRLGHHRDGPAPVLSETFLKEVNVGITEYISHEIPGFQGVIKQRYTDFLVNEVDQMGQIVRLKNLDVPAQVQTEELAQPLSADDVKARKDKVYVDMAALLTSEVSEGVRKMIESKGIEPKFVLTGKEPEKARRGVIHGFFKEHFKGIIISESHEGAIRIRLFVPKDKNDFRNREDKAPFVAMGGSYCRFVLYKENKDTMDVISNIARMLRLQPKQFGYAGTKDRRGVTVQQVTVYKVKAERVANAVNRPGKTPWEGVRVGDFKYVPNDLKLGDLKGNHFVITLRNVVSENPDTITASVNSLRDRGFINYFGMQRFGTSSIPTHTVGLALMRSQWEEAVELLLKPREGEREQFRKAREYWDQNRTDLKGALDLYPKWATAEVSLLKSLQRNGSKNYLGGLNGIPKNLRLMYVHAYQSFVWNHMASERIRLYGFKEPVAGDLVVVGQEQDAHMNTDAKADEAVIDSEELKDMNWNSNKITAVKALTVEELSNYSIYDIVLPQPGYGVIYPMNEIGEMYKAFMKKDGINADSMRSTSKAFSLSGDYRKLLVRPKDVDCTLLRYNSPTDPLSRTDLDVISGKPEPTGTPDGKYLALRVHLTLESSQYATMALRELTKTDTSARTQATLNNLDEGGEEGEDLDGIEGPEYKENAVFVTD